MSSKYMVENLLDRDPGVAMGSVNLRDWQITEDYRGFLDVGCPNSVVAGWMTHLLLVIYTSAVYFVVYSLHE
jgi:hypothetical protein